MVQTMSKMEQRFLKITGSLFLMVFSAALNFISAWLVMLGFGVAHHQWAAVPAFGYWATYLMLLAVSSIAGVIHGGMRVKWTDK